MTPAVQKYLVDPFERAGTTFAQQFALFLLASGGSLLVNQKYLAAADSAAFAAVIALLTSYILVLTGIKVTGWFDVVRRVVMTFGQSLLGTMGANEVTHSVVHANWLGALAIAVNVAGVAFLKSMIGLSLPNTVGGSLAPVAPIVPASPVVDGYDTTPAVTPTDYSTVQDGAVGTADASQLSTTSSEPPIDTTAQNSGTQVVYTPEHAAAADTTPAAGA